jgi:hypothetical protein
MRTGTASWAAAIARMVKWIQAAARAAAVGSMAEAVAVVIAAVAATVAVNALRMGRS